LLKLEQNFENRLKDARDESRRQQELTALEAQKSQSLLLQALQHQKQSSEKRFSEINGQFHRMGAAIQQTQEQQAKCMQEIRTNEETLLLVVKELKELRSRSKPSELVSETPKQEQYRQNMQVSENVGSKPCDSETNGSESTGSEPHDSEKTLCCQIIKVEPCVALLAGEELGQLQEQDPTWKIIDNESKLENPLLASKAPSKPPPAPRANDSLIGTLTVSETAHKNFEPIDSKLEGSEPLGSGPEILKISGVKFSENSHQFRPRHQTATKTTPTTKMAPKVKIWGRSMWKRSNKMKRRID
jgi:hypothetical protein